MPLATEQQIETMLGIELETSVAEIFLADAARAVELDGININHPDFNQLHRYYTAHLLEVQGTLNSQVVSESVGDVSRAYAPSTTPDGIGKFLKKYTQLKVQVTGFKNRIK
ncbi:MAG: DUF4054 domain-containing protein [Leptospiraceae bacterium]|nr:DUF4054 domain-containing protein [Leptospiraceae bacterium]